MFARLLLLLILVPLADLILLLQIAQWTGWTTSLLLVLISGLVGVWLARRQSISVGMKLRDQLAQNELPSGMFTDSAMILFAAGLLITPGPITDLLGLSLLVPSIRAWYKRQTLRWLKRHFQVQKSKYNSVPFEDGVVEGEVVSSSDDRYGQRQPKLPGLKAGRKAS